MNKHNSFSDLSPDKIMTIVMNESSSERLRSIAHSRFVIEAQVMNDTPESPFILWPAINKQPQPWLAALTGKIANQELQLDTHDLTIICVPSSATSYKDPLKNIFPKARFPDVLKQLNDSVKRKHSIPLEVPSYVHNRQMDGTRGTNTMHFFDLEQFKPNGTTLIVDDALAEGYTAIEIATFLTHQCKQDTIYFATPLAKKIQGGEKRIKENGIIKGISIVINVTETQGKGKPIQFV